MRQAFSFVLIIIFLFTANTAYPYWIWTPKTKKWVNPKTAVKPTPKEQFEFALTFFNDKQYEDAKREFKKLIQNYPKSFEAAESQYYLGRTLEEQHSLYEAYEAYQKVVDKYPFSSRIQEIIKREYDIAEAFMSGEKRKALGIVLPVDNPAIEILSKVVDNSTYGPLAAKAQYKLGLVLKEMMRYYEAEDAFNKVISSYPDSEWVAPSKFQIAACRSAVSRGPEYDQGAAGEAKQKFEEFVKEHPDAVLSQEAEKNITRLKNKEAQSAYDIAVFYEKQKAYTAAKVYYEEILQKYPDTVWAKIATLRLKALEIRK